jgi:hypothetical protein
MATLQELLLKQQQGGLTAAEGSQLQQYMAAPATVPQYAGIPAAYSQPVATPQVAAPSTLSQLAAPSGLQQAAPTQAMPQPAQSNIGSSQSSFSASDLIVPAAVVTGGALGSFAGPAGAAIGAGVLGGAAANYMGDQAVAGAQQDAAAQAQSAAADAAANAAVAGKKGGQYTQGNMYSGQETILDTGEAAQGALTEGRTQAEQQLGAGYGASTGQLTGAAQQAQGYLQGGATQAAGQLSQYQQDVAAARQRAGQNLDYQTAASQFQSDPGYQYALQQSEKAINRSAAAKGGRLGGSTLQALQQNAQGLANQQYGNYMQQRLGYGQAGASADYQGLGQQGAAASGLAGIYSGLGQGQANTALGLGSNLSNLSQGYYGNMANTASGFGSQLANLYTGTGSQIANLGMQGAAGYANALNNAATQNTSLTAATLPTYQAGAAGAGAGYRALGDLGGSLTQLGAMYLANQGQQPPQDEFGTNWAMQGNASFR